MIKIIEDSTDFLALYNSHKLPVVFYGAGKNIHKYLGISPTVDMICDKYKCGERIDNLLVNNIDEILNLGEEVYVIITVSNVRIYNEILSELESLEVVLYVVHACNNVSFAYNFWDTTVESYKKDEDILRVNIVCSDGSWIFRKFAEKMLDYLENEKVDARISEYTSEKYDINHHIPYIAYRPYEHDTLMITHVDTMNKVNMLKRQLSIASVGICMSKETMNNLVLYGIDRNKLCYVNPAHDGVIRPHKYLIGITHKCRDDEDFRKRDSAILDVLEGIDSNYFSFFVMGSGWDLIVEKIRKRGFEVEYYDGFDRNIYISKIPTLDYYLYMGFDEGSMGFLDAVAAGVGTIVTPQGFHMDTKCDVDFPCSTIGEFHDAFLHLQNLRKKKVESVSDWSWTNYTKKHIQIWDYLLKRKAIQEIYNNQHFYNDGIYSMMIRDNRICVQ